MTLRQSVKKLSKSDLFCKSVLLAKRASLYFSFFFQKFEAAEKAAEEAKRAKELQQKAESK